MNMKERATLYCSYYVHQLNYLYRPMSFCETVPAQSGLSVCVVGMEVVHAACASVNYNHVHAWVSTSVFGNMSWTALGQSL